MYSGLFLEFGFEEGLSRDLCVLGFQILLFVYWCLFLVIAGSYSLDIIFPSSEGFFKSFSENSLLIINLLMNFFKLNLLLLQLSQLLSQPLILNH